MTRQVATETEADLRKRFKVGGDPPQRTQVAISLIPTAS